MLDTSQKKKIKQFCVVMSGSFLYDFLHNNKYSYAKPVVIVVSRQ